MPGWDHSHWFIIINLPWLDYSLSWEGFRVPKISHIKSNHGWLRNAIAKAEAETVSQPYVVADEKVQTVLRACAPQDVSFHRLDAPFQLS